MTGYRTDALVSTQWLAENLASPDLRIVDATWYFPHENKNARAEFEGGHIPGAVFFDLDDISDDATDLPHMLPPAEKFSSKVRRLGLGDGSRIVVYDQKGVFSAPRAWWMFRVFGHSDVTVLDGGLPKWLAEARPIEDGPAAPKGERHFTARQNNTMVRTLEQVRRNIDARRECLVDARDRGRFEGTAEEPWPGRRKGRVPGSVNLPFADLIDPTSQTLRSPEELARRFNEAGVDAKRPVVTTCGSGITACVLALGLHVAGYKDVAVYDGSWAEWGRPGDTPVDTGPSSGDH